MIPRFAIKKDILGILELYKELNPDDPLLDTDKATLVWDKINKSGIIKYIVLEEQNVIISTCSIVVIPNFTRGARAYAVLENVITKKEHRNKGYGKLLIAKAIEHAKENNCYKIMFLSGVKRTEAHRFYERLGFNRHEKVGFVMSL